MASTYGSADFMLDRLKSNVPGGWFSFFDPVRDAVLGGLATSLAAIYSLITAVKAATRTSTASGWILDLIAWDFFGSNFLRWQNESDAHWSARFTAEIFRERVTRSAIVSAILALTGRVPAIFDPDMPQDTGGYRVPMMGYGKSGAYGSLSHPNELFITAFRPTESGIPGVNGYGGTAGGYGVGYSEYCDISQVEGVVTDADIEAVIKNSVASGVDPVISLSY